MRQPPGPDDPTTVGRFRIVGLLGSGGMGRVLLGEDSDGRQAAIKLVHTEFVDDSGFRARFRREVQLAAQAPPGWTAPFLDADPDAPRPWLATAFLDAPSLLEHLTEHGSYQPAEAATLGNGLAAALSALHHAGLVHRDLKPSNVLLTDGGPRLIDFGISRAVDGTALTATGQSVGTPEYMSPEQVIGAEAGPPSDVFSLGSLLVFAVRGRTPFAAGSPTGALYRVVHDEPDLAPELGPLLPVLRSCLAKDPVHRPTAPQVRDGLGAVAARLGAGEQPGGPGTTAGPAATLVDRFPADSRGDGGIGAGRDHPASDPPPTRAGVLAESAEAAPTVRRTVVDAGQVDPRPAGPGEVGAGQVGPGPVGIGQAGAGPVGTPAQAGAGQIGAGEIDPAGSRHDGGAPGVYAPGPAAPDPGRYGPGDGGWSAPPPGWSDRPPATRVAPPGPPGPRSAGGRRRTVLLAAGAVLLAVLLGVGGTLTVLALRPDPGATSGTQAATPSSNPFPAPTGAAPTTAPADILAGASLVDTTQDIRYGSPSDQLTFASPTGNIACSLASFEVRCDVGERNWQIPPRPATCQQAFGTGARLAGAAPAELTCVGDTLANPALPRLDYGRALRTTEVTCVSRNDGVECRNSTTGHGFTVSRAAYRLY